VNRRYETGRPSEESLAAITSAAASVQVEREDIRDWFSAYVNTHLQRLAFDLDEIRRCFQTNDRILELGSTPPVLTVALLDQGYRVEGIDIAPERFGRTIKRHGLTIHRCNLEKDPLPFADASFDGIICNEILEHLRGDLIAIFEDVLRVLKPGGRLILTTPNIRSVEGMLRFLFAGRSISCGGGIYDEYNKIRTLGHMGHVREYTVKEVREFLSRLDYEIETVVHRGCYSGWRQIIAGLFPRMYPFMQFVARKQATPELD